MEKYWTVAQALITALSVGGLLTAWSQFFIERRKNLFQKNQEFKETRYKAIIILMHGFLNFSKSKNSLEHIRPDLKSAEDLSFELETEWHNMILFASDEVLIRTKRFLESPDEQTFWQVGLAMRKDLYKLKTKVELKDLYSS